MVALPVCNNWTAGLWAAYFTMTKCNNLFIRYLTHSTECLPTLPSSISTISMPVVKKTLFNMRAQCNVKYKVLNMG